MSDTESESSMPTPGRGTLAIDADLTVETPEGSVRIRTADATVYVDVDDASTLWSIYRGLRGIPTAAPGRWVGVLRATVDESVRVETPVVVRVRGVSILRYLPEQQAGRVGRVAARLLGVAPFRPDLSGTVRVAIRRARS